MVFNDKLIIETAGQRVELPIPNYEALQKSGLENVILGLRPEMITEPKPFKESTYITHMQFDVQVTEPTGPDTLAFGEWNQQELQARLSPEIGVQAETETTIDIQVDTSKAVLFHPQSGERI